MSCKYRPWITAKFRLKLSPNFCETVVPNARGTDQSRLWSKGSETNLRLFVRNNSAIAANLRLDALHKERGTPHHTSTQNNDLRCKQRYKIGKTKPKIVSFALHGLFGEGIALAC